ncbi:calcium-activated chloride channel regulator 4-like [Castor canadensis]|uniref:Calcium-activated chloride channel regulator 4-like n=1 Tax=Castor canadensis TaxID=51338 RepID=A0AC58MXB7_CASCN
MVLFRGLVFLLLLYLLQGSNSSFVKLNDNGYEDIIVAIDPGVPEDENIIEQLKEQYELGKSLLKSLDTGTAWKGEQLDMTKETPEDEPMDAGRLLVHEWAHLRWGVFDEYNEDQPFYSAKSKKIEATRCSTGISGLNRVYTCQGGSCVFRACRTNSTTKLYEKDCQFFPDEVQTEKASVMFMKSIDSVVEFCNGKTHNHEAPSLQNIKCGYRSTWEVISNSEDFKNSTPMETSPPPPVFSLLRPRERIVCLVLDKSGSMSLSDRLNRMNQAAKFFLLQTVENGSWVGMVHFDNTASIKSELIQIKGNTERNTLLESLPSVASGGTSICKGIETVFQTFPQFFLPDTLWSKQFIARIVLQAPWLTLYIYTCNSSA